MRKIFHYGDSYATVGTNSKHFITLIAEKLKYDYNGSGTVPGGSNEMILNKLLSNILKIKRGDILFFNFSFFVRGSYYDKETGEVMSTNRYYNDMELTHTVNPRKDYIMDIINYQLDHNEDYNRRIFYQFDTIFRELDLMGVKIYYIFIVENEWSNSLLQYGTRITFPIDFYTWLYQNEYHNQEDCHYTFGVQGHICDYVMEQFSPEDLKIKFI